MYLVLEGFREGEIVLYKVKEENIIVQGRMVIILVLFD